MIEQPITFIPDRRTDVRAVVGRSSHAFLTAILFVCVGLGACGDDDATPSATTGNSQQVTSTAPVSTAPTDVCGLLTFQEVSAAVGAAATDRAATVPPIKQEVSPGLIADISACSYSAESTGDFVKLDLWEAKGQAAKIKEVTEFVCSDKEVIPGLGDFACWYSAGHREILLAKGGAYIDIESGTLTNDAVKALAEKVVARLP